MIKGKILIIDDEEDILELVRYNLAKNGYNVVCATSGEVGLVRVREHRPDLILLDLMLPGLDGLDICKILRNESNTLHIPIIMLTARGEDADIVAGLELGADDYITKPFSPRVLLARVKAVLRRLKSESIEDNAIIKIHGIIINPGRHEIIVENQSLDLTATEFRILNFLAKRPGWVFTRDQIINAVKGDDYPVTERSVDVQVVGLRKKLGEAGKNIETVRGVGYRFRE
jgi:two-component system, OmpR family, alkaline phosphatase synthesis response regulator PhoP